MKKRLAFLVFLSFVSVVLSGCGGGTGTPSAAASSGSGGSNNSSLAPNAVSLTVDAGPNSNDHNVAFISIKVCAHSSTINCQTIDHILVDTGSTGLRLLADAMSPSVNSALSQAKLNNSSLVECMQFLDGFSWGPLKKADITIGNYTVSNMTIQIIGDSSFSSIPTRCSNTGASDNTTANFGAKGILGISNTRQDCGSTCAQSSNSTLYYQCSNATTCQPTTVTVDSQLQQPISLFSQDNNGSLIQLPALTANVGTNVQGSLIFGIGTQSNNSVGSNASILYVHPSTSTLTAQLQNSTYSFAFIDSGSTDWIFDDNGLMPTCSTGFYCPSSSQTLTTIFTDIHATSSTFNFSIANASEAFNDNPIATAFDNIGAPARDSQSGNLPHTTFIAGLPFFYGRSVWTAIEDAPTPSGTGPYVAFQ